MPGLQFQNLPATQQDPMGILKSRYDQSEQYLRSQYDTELNSLKQQSLADKDFFNQLNQLNTKYTGALNQERYKADQQVQSIKRIQTLMESGQIASDAGQEAVWRLILPSETEKAMFQTADRGRPLSLSQLRAREPEEEITKIEASIGEFVEVAPTIPKLLTLERNEPKTKEGLINQYRKWRRYLGFESLEPIVQRQYDDEWDAYMAGDKRFDEWWSDKTRHELIVEIKALRTPGKIGKIMRGRITGADGISPLGRSIVRTKPREPWFGFPGGPPPPAPSQKKTAVPLSEETLRRRGTKEAYEEGKKLGYWE